MVLLGTLSFGLIFFFLFRELWMNWQKLRSTLGI